MQLNAGVIRCAPSHSGQGCAQDDNRARLSGEVILPDYGLMPEVQSRRGLLRGCVALRESGTQGTSPLTGAKVPHPTGRREQGRFRNGEEGAFIVGLS